MTITKIHLPVRLFAPSVKSRLFDPMPLPKRRAAARRARITVMSVRRRAGVMNETAVKGGAAAGAGENVKSFGEMPTKTRRASSKKLTFKV